MNRGLIGGLILWLMSGGLWMGTAWAQFVPPAPNVVALPAITDTVDLGNSTRDNLGATVSFYGRAFDTLGFAYTNVWVLASQLSLPNGLRFDWSADGGLTSNNFRTLESASILESGRAYTFAFAPKARYFRVQYVNGGTALTSFTLATIHRGGSFSNNSVLVSDVSAPWRGAYLTSAYESFAVNSQQLGSVLLVRGKAGTQIAVYHLLTTQSALGSIGLYTDAEGRTPSPIWTPLWSNNFVANGGAVMPPFGGPKKPSAYFCANLASSLWGMVVGSFQVNWNILYSYEAPSVC